MYYGQAILSESYLDNIFNHTQMILDSENFISNLYEAEGNKENFIVRIFKFIKEKIIAVINAIKKVYNWIVEKIKEFKNKHSKSKLDDVKIVGVVKDEETADEVINNFKDAVNKANEEVKSAAKDMEDTKANVANNIKERHDIFNQYMKDITESIKKNTESFEDSQSNIDEMLKDIDDSLDDLLDEADKSTSKNLPAVVGEKKKFAILVNKEDTIELVNYNGLSRNLYDATRENESILESMSEFKFDKIYSIYSELRRKGLNNKGVVFKAFTFFLKKNINNFDSLKNELEDILKIENTSKSVNKLFHFKESVKNGFEHFKRTKRAEYFYTSKTDLGEWNYLNCESDLRYINKSIIFFKKIQTNFESKISSIEKVPTVFDDDFIEAVNHYKEETIEAIKISNYLINYIGRCIIASQQQKLRFENWLAEHLRFIYY